jgi:hypothetical protein
MIETDIGRLLVASLHQAIADLLPARLEFYEAWLNPAGLRDGRIGLAPLAAVLSFLRQEGEPYRLVTARAGEYTAEWTVAGLSAFKGAVMRAAPPALRARLVMRVARSIVRSTCRSSRAGVRWRKGRATVSVYASIFCRVRSPAEQPLCEFYAAAIRRLMMIFGLDAEIDIEQCLAIGADHCLMVVRVRPAGVAE